MPRQCNIPMSPLDYQTRMLESAQMREGLLRSLLNELSRMHLTTAQNGLTLDKLLLILQGSPPPVESEETTTSRPQQSQTTSRGEAAPSASRGETIEGEYFLLTRPLAKSLADHLTHHPMGASLTASQCQEMRELIQYAYGAVGCRETL